MFNAKYRPYEMVPHSDSGEDNHDIDDNQITNLLKQTAHRRIRQNSESHDNGSACNNDSDIDLSDENNTETSPLKIDIGYDEFVFLLFLDGRKSRVGIMNNWTICDLKYKYFKQELSENKNIRFIYRGKLLQDATRIDAYNIPTDGFIHVSISNSSNVGAASNANKSTSITYEEFDDGMNDEMIARQLHEREMQMIGADQGDHDDVDTFNALDQDRARREFLCGMFLGSVAGIWILIFLILAQRGYSRRFRLGVTVGVVLNILIQLTFGQNSDVNSNQESESESEPSDQEQPQSD